MEGNARLTASTAGVLFVLLAVEGATIVSITRLLRIHVFVGLLLVPPIVLKTASTGYRIVRYYLGAPAYVRRGPPPRVLRVLGPLVVVLTIAVLATGIVLLFLRPGHRSPWLELHQGVFCAWFVVMTAHVLGHLAETARVAPRDWRLGGPSVVGAGIRRALVGGSVVAGLVLGIWGQSRVADWCGGRVRLPAGQVVVRTWC